MVLLLGFAIPVTAFSPVQDASPLQVEARNIAHAILVMETNGSFDCTRKGLSGEKGCYQFMRSTWNSYSTEVFGEVREQTFENEKAVVEAKIALWLEEGYTPRQVFLIWNQGHGGQCIRGINKYGVAYDSCAYAERGLSLI